jgi:hypothetical protein
MGFITSNRHSDQARREADRNRHAEPDEVVENDPKRSFINTKQWEIADCKSSSARFKSSF